VAQNRAGAQSVPWQSRVWLFVFATLTSLALCTEPSDNQSENQPGTQHAIESTIRRIPNQSLTQQDFLHHLTWGIPLIVEQGVPLWWSAREWSVEWFVRELPSGTIQVHFSSAAVIELCNADVFHLYTTLLEGVSHSQESAPLSFGNLSYSLLPPYYFNFREGFRHCY
jgi:hypothetical protein